MVWAELSAGRTANLGKKAMVKLDAAVHGGLGKHTTISRKGAARRCCGSRAWLEHEQCRSSRLRPETVR